MKSVWEADVTVGFTSSSLFRSVWVMQKLGVVEAGGWGGAAERMKNEGREGGTHSHIFQSVWQVLLCFLFPFWWSHILKSRNILKETWSLSDLVCFHTRASQSHWLSIQFVKVRRIILTMNQSTLALIKKFTTTLQHRDHFYAKQRSPLNPVLYLIE